LDAIPNAAFPDKKIFKLVQKGSPFENKIEKLSNNTEDALKARADNFDGLLQKLMKAPT
jgi:hypothetical protein